MALTPQSLWEEFGIDPAGTVYLGGGPQRRGAFDADNPNDPTVLQWTKLLAVGTALVDKYLRGGIAPEAIRDEAIIRTVGHARARVDFGLTRAGPAEFGGLRFNLSERATSSVRQSGAAALLSPWVNRSA